MPNKPMNNAGAATSFKGALKRLFHELEGYRKLVFLAVILAILGAVLSILAPNQLSNITDEISQGLVINRDNLTAISESITAELSEEMQMPEDKVREIMKIAQEPVSLETPIGEEEDSHLGDFIPDDDIPAPAEAAAFTLLKEQLMEVLDTLTDREEKVLRLRFGLDDGRARTLEEVGKEFNVTRERIRQIEAKALRKLRHPSRSKKLKDYLE